MASPFSLFNTRSATDPGAPVRDFIAVTGTPTIYSETITGEDTDGFGATFFYTGTLTGTFTAWTTDKPLPNLANDDDWVQDTTFVPVNPAGAAGKFRDDQGNSKGSKKRYKYVNASGTGNLSGWATTPKTAH